MQDQNFAPTCEASQCQEHGANFDDDCCGYDGDTGCANGYRALYNSEGPCSVGDTTCCIAEDACDDTKCQESGNNFDSDCCGDAGDTSCSDGYIAEYMPWAGCNTGVHVGITCCRPPSEVGKSPAVGVSLYAGSSFVGGRGYFLPGNYDRSDLASKVANVGSLVVNPGFQAVMYTDSHFQGTATVVPSGRYAGELTDNTASMQVQLVAASADTQCTDFSLPAQAWPGATTTTFSATSVSYQTPVSEFPTTRDACEAGDAIIDHAHGWLARATDYHLQAVVTNAAAIAQQLCLEERLLYMPCFSLSETQMATLASIYSDACELADVLGKINAAGDPFQPNEVKPLTYTMYESFFQQANADIQRIMLNQDVESSALQVIQQNEIDSSATSRDDALWYARQAQVNTDMADAYFASVRQLQNQINLKQQALGIDQSSLIASLQSQVAAQHTALTAAKDQADLAAKKQLAVDVGKTLFSVILAVLAAPETGGLSVVVAAAQTAEFVGGNKDVQNATKSLATDAVTYGSEVHADHGCGHLNQQECDDLNAQIDAATEQLRNVRDCLGSLDGLMRFNDIVLDERVRVTASDLPKISLLRASLGQIDASVTVQVFANAATLGSVATDVSQLVALIQSKFDVVTNYYKAKLSSQDAASQRTSFQHQAERAQALAQQSEARISALETYLDVQLRSKCFVLLQYLIQQTQAYEYMALASDHNIVQTLQQLAVQKITVHDYAQLLADAHSN